MRFAREVDVGTLQSCIVDRWTLDRDLTELPRSTGEKLYVLGDGFAFDYSIHSSGRRHVFDFYAPGAICNWPRAAREGKPEFLHVKARSEVFVLDRPKLDRMLVRKRELAQAIEEHETRRAMRIAQRVRALISLPARDSLRVLLLDMDDEFGTVGAERRWVPLPLTQEEIGDIIGSTSVHVSRTMAGLEKDGEIERRAATFRIVDIDQMRASMSYRRFFDPPPADGAREIG